MKKYFKTILFMIVIVATSLTALVSCAKDGTENDLKTSDENIKIPETELFDEEKTIDFLKSEAEKYAQNTLGNVGTTIYLGKSQIAEYPYQIACINESDTRGIVFAMKEEDGVGVIGSQSYYQGGYPISKTILDKFQ